MLYNMQKVLYNFCMNTNNNAFNADGEYGKRGYLKENYRVFHIKDRCNKEFEFHYHEFDKIVFFLSGNVTYIIEGKSYCLKPYDILLVSHGDIHRPVIDSAQEYERVIIWTDSNSFNSGYALSQCFDDAREKGLNLIRSDNSRKRIFDILLQLTSENGSSFASDLMRDTLFMQLMILINRSTLDNTVPYRSDNQIEEIMKYINENLFSDLTVEKISNDFFISRYHLMHKFKQVTGKTVFSYIQTKRLLHAASMLNNGMTAKQACFESGYKDYSVFLRAFKKEFKTTPAEYKRKPY